MDKFSSLTFLIRVLILIYVATQFFLSPPLNVAISNSELMAKI